MNKKEVFNKNFAPIKEKYMSKKDDLPAEAVAICNLFIDFFEAFVDVAFIKSTSANSGTAPSKDKGTSDGKKGKNGKKKNPKKPPHDRKSLKQTDSPDKIIPHYPDPCVSCATVGDHVLKSKHQVFDVIMKVEVTEHQIYEYHCQCGKHHEGRLPKNVSMAPCQYGPGVKSVATELTYKQFIPLARVRNFFRDNFDLPISNRTIQNIGAQAFKKLEEWENTTKDIIIKNAFLINTDETGVMVNKKNHWIHTISTSEHVLMYVHEKRGIEAINDIGILPNYEGYLVHDFWSSYSHLDAIHITCNEHIKRELEKAGIDYKAEWAIKLQKLLLKANDLRLLQDGILTYKQIKSIERRYFKIIKLAETETPLKVDRENIRGRIGQTYPRQLLSRLIKHSASVLMFLYCSELPFTNNVAERDLRMTKVQQKVSGCFRTFAGAEKFCRIRSFILSEERAGRNSTASIQQLFGVT